MAKYKHALSTELRNNIPKRKYSLIHSLIPLGNGFSNVAVHYIYIYTHTYIYIYSVVYKRIIRITNQTR